jgi:hypothetical protein
MLKYSLEYKNENCRQESCSRINCSSNLPASESVCPMAGGSKFWNCWLKVRARSKISPEKRTFP